VTQKTNEEGLTFAEWLAAATAFGGTIERPTAERAWKRGEDPTEYAYHLSQVGHVGMGLEHASEL
jgi:hypothetical protein